MYDKDVRGLSRKTNSCSLLRAVRWARPHGRVQWAGCVCGLLIEMHGAALEGRCQPAEDWVEHQLSEKQEDALFINRHLH